MKKTDLAEVLRLVKQKIAHNADAACGLFWPDTPITSYYAVGEEDQTTEYSVGEEDECLTLYGIGECD